MITIKRILLLFFLVSVFASVYVVANSVGMSEGFQFLWIWPCIYSCIILFLYLHVVFKPEHSIALLFTYCFRYFMRFIAYPIAATIAGSSYSPVARFVTLSEIDIVNAIVICAVEIVLVTIVVFFLEHKNSNKKDTGVIIPVSKRELSLYGSKRIYYIYLLIAIVVLVFYGIPHNLLSFFSISEVEFEWSNVDTIIKYYIIMSLAIGVMMVFDSQVNSKKTSYIRVFKCLFVSILFTGIIQGGSRAFQSYVALILITILIQVFPKYRSIITVSIAATFGIVLLLITFAREGGTSRWFGSINSFAGMLQIYFGGPTSIANPIKIFQTKNQVSIFNLFFDYFSLFPMSLIVGGLGYSTSELYNLAIYNGLSLSGHIVFAPAYGYIYWGIVGIAFTMIANVLITCFFNKLYYKTQYYETKYLFGFCLFRCTSGLLTHPAQYLSGVFQYLIIMGLLLIISNAIKNKGRITLWAK